MKKLFVSICFLILFNVYIPSIALCFVFPVLGEGGGTNSYVDSTIIDGWTISSNNFGNYYPTNPIKDGCSCPTCDYHPAEDWNRNDHREDGDSVDVSKNDLEQIYSIGDGEIVRKERDNAFYGGTILVRYDLGDTESLDNYFLDNTTPVNTYNKSRYVLAQWMHTKVYDYLSVGDDVILGESLGVIDSGYRHLHFELMSDPDNNSSTARNSCGYYTSQQSITDYGYIDPAEFIIENASVLTLETRYTFETHNSNGWTLGYDIEEAQGNDIDTFQVHITGNNPGFVSPLLTDGLIARDVIVQFSVRVLGNDSPVIGEIFIQDEFGSWQNSVKVGKVGTDDEYHIYSVPLGSVLRPDLEVNKISFELTNGSNGTDEYWAFEWVEIITIDRGFEIAGSGGGIYEPSNLIANAVSVNQINLSWDRGLNPQEIQNLQYGIYDCSDNLIAITENTYYSHTGLQSLFQYCYAVKAVVDEIESGYSNQVEATTLPPTSYNNIGESLTCKYVDPNDPWDHGLEYTTFYNEDGFVYLWTELTNVNKSLTVNWKWYNPQGGFDSESTYQTDNPADFGLDYWDWYRLFGWIDLSATENYGNWKVNIYIDGVKVHTRNFLLTVSINPPTNLLSTEVLATRVDLSWQGVSEAEVYRVYRSGSLLAEISETTFIDNTVDSDSSYRYIVVAVKKGVESQPSNELNLSTPVASEEPITLEAPTGLKIISTQ